MKKITALLLALMMAFTLLGCRSTTVNGVQVFVPKGRGDVDEVWIEEMSSEVYEEGELEVGVAVVLDYFKKHYGNSALWEVAYVGDENLETYKMAALRNGSDQVMAFSTTIDVGLEPENASLIEGSVYSDYVFILAYLDDEWQVVSIVDEEE